MGGFDLTLLADLVFILEWEVDCLYHSGPINEALGPPGLSHNAPIDSRDVPQRKLSLGRRVPNKLVLHGAKPIEGYAFWGIVGEQHGGRDLRVDVNVHPDGAHVCARVIGIIDRLH